MIKKMRLTTLNLNGGSMHNGIPAQSGLQSNGFSGAHMGVDEMVYSPQGGVLATLQDPPQLSQLSYDGFKPSSHSYLA